MHQTTVTLTPKADRDDVSGFQAMSPVQLTDDVTMTVSIDGADDDTAGHLIWFAIAAAVVLAGCETNNVTVINGSGNTVNPTGTSTNASGSANVGGGKPR